MFISQEDIRTQTVVEGIERGPHLLTDLDSIQLVHRRLLHPLELRPGHPPGGGNRTGPFLDDADGDSIEPSPIGLNVAERGKPREDSTDHFLRRIQDIGFIKPAAEKMVKQGLIDLDEIGQGLSITSNGTGHEFGVHARDLLH